ncbi:hypothetical protein B0T20DRAFT_467503 [Sordaria brevicollis]|uniref:Uncharacterized protein n=1 Tax=Sordaria brevicollis TaxID=83679 RepID=A0AAE0PIX8_SORBR|nr:hypothetical protein B0T20DRAFT_467503 [Sordaria brevicollis]
MDLLTVQIAFSFFGAESLNLGPCVHRLRWQYLVHQEALEEQIFIDVFKPANSLKISHNSQVSHGRHDNDLRRHAASDSPPPGLGLIPVSPKERATAPGQQQASQSGPRSGPRSTQVKAR